MIVAEIQITAGRSFGNSPVVHSVRFADLDRARSEYDRIAALFKDRGDKKNDLPKEIEVVGDGNKVSMYFDDVAAIGLADFAKADAEAAGTRDAFPNLFKR